jgi:hypothetical protein
MYTLTNDKPKTTFFYADLDCIIDESFDDLEEDFKEFPPDIKHKISVSHWGMFNN